MNAGYVRLSRDDDKRNYVSIENQKLIINQYAADHGVVIDRWYEDDGISGYIFDRPGFFPESYVSFSYFRRFSMPGYPFI